MTLQAVPHEDTIVARAAEDLAHREEAHFRQADGLHENRLDYKYNRVDQIRLDYIRLHQIDRWIQHESMNGIGKRMEGCMKEQIENENRIR